MHSDSPAVQDTEKLIEQGSIVLALSESPFYQNFLERFLVAIGRPLRLPWWAVQTVLYSATVVLFVRFLNVPRLYPHAGYVSFGLEQVGEFLFTTFMICHLRNTRNVAILAVSRVRKGTDRLIWLRSFLAPSSWGWVVRSRGTRWTIRAWLVTLALLLAYWGGQFIYYRGGAMGISHAKNYWDASYPLPQFVYLYPTIAKAAMFVAVAAYFWWLRGSILIARGKCPSTLTVQQRELLYLRCSELATRFMVMVSATALLWVCARALAYGFGFWAYLYSGGLLFLLAAQIGIFADVKPSHWVSVRFFRQVIASEFIVDWPVTHLGQLAGLVLIWGPILGLGPLARLVGSYA